MDFNSIMAIISLFLIVAGVTYNISYIINIFCQKGKSEGFLAISITLLSYALGIGIGYFLFFIL